MDENFRYKTNNYSLHFVLRQIDSGRMEINPEFIDSKSWSLKQKSQFVESVILGIPTQPIWCEETASGDFIVIEGSERLNALVEFAEGKFNLTGLKLRKEYIGCNFHLLPYYEKLTLEDRYTLTFIIINYDTAPQLKCEFFRRLLSDTGRNGDQAARNFAWRRAFEFIQSLKRECEPLLEFAPRDSRWRLQLRTNKASSSIDEVFLYLLMIYNILSGDVYEEAYLDSSISIDDLLDWTMRYFDKGDRNRFHAGDTVVWGLRQIANKFEHRPKVVLSNSMRVHYENGDDLALPELYLLFVKACANKISEPIDWRDAKIQRFINSSSAKNLISYIFQARND